MNNPKFAESHLLAHEVNVQLNVFRSSMMNWIGRHIHCRYIVTEDHCSLGERRAEFVEELPQPDAVSDGISNSTIFSLRTRA
jgi:hypothetical protein